MNARLVPTLLLLAVLAAGCRTIPTLPPVDLEAPAWSVRHGQAVWTATPGATGVAGELMVATRTDGASFVQFSKPPFTLAMARAEPAGWALETPPPRRRLGGRGPAPGRLIWFALASAFRGQPPGEHWQFERTAADGWRLTNARTGETLEGFLAP